MTPNEIMTVQDAVDVIANCPMTSDERVLQMNIYRWFLSILQARHDLELVDSAGCLDADL